MPKSNAGQKTKYTPEMCQKAEELMAQGSLKKHVCVHLGISEESFYKYIREHTEFAEAIKRGESKYVKWATDKIRDAGDKSWQAHAWILERVYRDDFALKQEVQHSGAVVNVDHKVDIDDPDELREHVLKLSSE